MVIYDGLAFRFNTSLINIKQLSMLFMMQLCWIGILMIKLCVWIKKSELLFVASDFDELSALLLTHSIQDVALLSVYNIAERLFSGKPWAFGCWYSVMSSQM